MTHQEQMQERIKGKVNDPTLAAQQQRVEDGAPEAKAKASTIVSWKTGLGRSAV